jgi:integrase/recombinase XerC
MDGDLTADDYSVSRVAAPLDRTATQKQIALFLENASETTRVAYAHDLDDYARYADAPTAHEAIAALLASGHGLANARALAYRNALRKRRLAAATINRRLAALRSCVRLARLIGMIAWTIDVPGLFEAYRDTKGPGVDGVAKVLARGAHARRGAGSADVDLGLRRVKIHRLDLADVDLATDVPCAAAARRATSRFRRRDGPGSGVIRFRRFW